MRIDGFGGVVVVQLADQFIEEPHVCVKVGVSSKGFVREEWDLDGGRVVEVICSYVACSDVMRDESMARSLVYGRKYELTLPIAFNEWKDTTSRSNRGGEVARFLSLSFP
jgi:hypothetical protein